MSEASNAGSPAGELQFDRAEFAAPAPAATCRACGQTIRDLYYDVNGQPFCQTCRGHLQQALEGGSKVGRFLRAALYGSLAGSAGAAIYYGITEATNVNFGLISVLVGLMVGKAVKKGSDGRGGWFYQALAILLTYTAIVFTYIPPLIQGIAAARDQQPAAAQNPPANKAEAQAEAEAEAIAKADVPGEAGAKPPPSLGRALLALGFLLGLAFALPVWANLDSPIGLIIVAIGLYEAWTINRRVPLAITGPYRIGPARAGSAVDVPSAG